MVMLRLSAGPKGLHAGGSFSNGLPQTYPRLTANRGPCWVVEGPSITG